MSLSLANEQLVAELLRAHTGQELPDNRRWRIASALTPLCREIGLASVDQLVARLALNRHGPLARREPLAERVVEALLNNETYFFRDRALFGHLAEQILPALARARAQSRTLRIWSVGCSTGQEVYTLAMLFAQDEARWSGWSISILGTDVSGNAIEVARKGCYSQFQIQRGLTMSQTVDWFEQTPQGWRARDRLRRMVRFEEHNLLDPLPLPAGGQPPLFDLVLCRNVLLYFDAATRQRALARMATGLASDGWLMLGAGETTAGLTGRLRPERAAPGFFRHAGGRADGCVQGPASGAYGAPTRENETIGTRAIASPSAAEDRRGSD